MSISQSKIKILLLSINETFNKVTDKFHLSRALYSNTDYILRLSETIFSFNFEQHLILLLYHKIEVISIKTSHIFFIIIHN